MIRKYLFILLWLYSTLALGQSATTEQIIQAWQSRHAFQGVVLVADAQGIQSEQAFGLADRSWAVPMTPDAKFPIASVTKTFTAGLTARAVAEGKVQWTDSLGAWLPLAGSPLAKITLEQLVHHTSGLPHWEGIPRYWAVESHLSHTPEEAFACMQQVPLRGIPGQNYHYSSLGYWWLAKVLEAAYAQPFGHILSSHYLQPLSMANTGTLHGLALLPHLVEGYHQLRPDSVVQAPHRQYDLMLGGGNMYSTAKDLYRWCRAQLQNEEHVGWQVHQNEASEATWYYHGGGTWGASSLVSLQPAQGRVVILLSNHSGIPIETQWRALLWELEQGPSGEVPTEAVASRPLADYTGTYAAESGVQLRVWLHQQRLMARLGSNPPFSLAPTQPETFFGRAIEGTFAFGAENNDAIESLRVTRFGQTFEFKKLP